MYPSRKDARLSFTLPAGCIISDTIRFTYVCVHVRIHKSRCVSRVIELYVFVPLGDDLCHVLERSAYMRAKLWELARHCTIFTRIHVSVHQANAWVKTHDACAWNSWLWRVKYTLCEIMNTSNIASSRLSAQYVISSLGFSMVWDIC